MQIYRKKKNIWTLDIETLRVFFPKQQGEFKEGVIKTNATAAPEERMGLNNPAASLQNTKYSSGLVLVALR